MSASSGSNAVPKHVAIIMDGNNRWAKQRGLPSLSGHQTGAERIRDVLKGARELGIEVVTLFAFSSENWRRPAAEVQGLMSIFASYLKKEIKSLKEQGIRLRVIGNRSRFSSRLQKLIVDAEMATRDGQFTLVLAVDYGGQWDIANAARELALQVERGELSAEKIDEDAIASHICLADLPPVDLCIRTASEYRISNFLLWQLAYAELYFCPCLWPDFTQAEFAKAVDSFAARERRFGMTTEQLHQDNDKEKERA